MSVGRPFEARYPGRCPCGGAIDSGDRVLFAGDVVVHEGCEHEARDRGRAARAAEVCTECWLEKPCSCDGERSAS